MNPITYPMRPVSGGVFTGQILPGDWRYESKINGERLLVHGWTKTAFNRHGELSSHADYFKAALDKLQALSNETFISWWDCEALALKHNIGKGTLVVLDWVPTTVDFPVPWRARKDFIMRHVSTPAGLVCSLDLTGRLAYAEDHPDPAIMWKRGQVENERLGCQFYEGIVAKRADSLYNVQLQSPSQESSSWVKYRWLY